MHMNNRLMHYVRKGFYVLKDDGLAALFGKLRSTLRRSLPPTTDYAAWARSHEPSLQELEDQKRHRFPVEPMISIVVASGSASGQELSDMVRSVLDQSQSAWELCIADASGAGEVRTALRSYTATDRRIRSTFVDRQKGGAAHLNDAIALSSGEFIAFLGEQDLLAPDALHEVVAAVNTSQDADVIYSDEDRIGPDGRTRSDPHFKPDWSPDTFRSINYIGRLAVVRKTLLERVGLFQDGYEGSQDYDLLLRATEKARQVIHIPRVLYHRRSQACSAASVHACETLAHESGKRALHCHLSRQGVEGAVEDGLAPCTYRVSYRLSGGDKISIIIPNKDHPDDLRRCVESIVRASSYRNYEILIVENGSRDKRTSALYSELVRKYGHIRIVEWHRPFNYAAVNNHAVDHATGGVLLFLNNDTEVITAAWMERMLEHAVRDEIGAVGAKLVYPDGKIQHAGLILGIGGVAGHGHKQFSRNAPGYCDRLRTIQNVSAVTAACLMMRKDVFTDVQGFDERYALAFNDVDLCMKVRQKGLLVLFTPYAELYHHEHRSRGHDYTADEQARFRREIDQFTRTWGAIVDKGDPYYNRNLTLEREDFSLRVA